MVFYKLFSHLSRTIPRTSLLSAQRIPQQQFHNFSNQFHSLLNHQSTNKLIPVQVNFLCPFINSSRPKFGFCSSASTETEDKKGNNVHNGDSTNDDSAKTSDLEANEIDQAGQAKPADQTEESGSISDLSSDDLIKSVAEKEELLKLKQKEIDKIHAEMKNLRIQHEAADAANLLKALLAITRKQLSESVKLRDIVEDIKSLIVRLIAVTVVCFNTQMVDSEVTKGVGSFCAFVVVLSLIPYIL